MIGLTLALAALVAQADIPDHPDKLTFKPLEFKVPDAASMRHVTAGVPVYLLEDPALPIVNLTIFVRSGAYEDPEGKEGLAGLTARMMRVGGTETRNPDVLDEELDFLAANLSVSLGDTYGSASLSVLSKDLDKGLEILFDVLRHPAFDAGKLRTLKAQTLVGLRARNDSTRSIEARETSLLLYGDHPLNRMATKGSIDAITRDDLATFHKGAFFPRRFTVAASGAFRQDDLLAKLAKAFGDWPSPEKPPLKVPPATHVPKPGIYAFHKEGENITQGRLTMGHLGVDLRHPDAFALRLASYILGAGGFSSRLMQKVRTEEGLAYSVYSDMRPGTEYAGQIRVAFQSKSESVAYAAKLCLEEIAKMKKDGVTDKELQDAIRFYLDGFPAFFFPTKARTVSTFARAEMIGMPEGYYETWRDKIASVTTADIQRVVREHLHPEKFAWVVVGNMEAIKKGDGKHKVTLSDLGEVIDVPLPDPLTLERPEK